jgi:UTP--glucose-1-phosphate uridylyltransferase
MQYIVEEGMKAGIKNFVVVTGKNKSVIEDHFDTYPELENFLRSKKKEDLLEGLLKIINSTNFIYVRQKEPLGLGHAIWTAKHVIGKEHIAIFLPDELIFNPVPAIGQLIQIAQQEKCNVIAVREVPIEHTQSYGIIGIRKQISPNLFQVRELIEKPSPAQAPSNLAIVGRYILSPTIFEMLNELKIGVGGEVQLTDAIQSLLLSGEKVFAYKIQGMRYDIGTPIGLLRANLDLALLHPKYAQEVAAYLESLDKEYLMIQSKSQSIKKSPSISL